MSTFISHAIGSSFPSEVAAAGLNGLPFSYIIGGSGVVADAALPDDKLATLEALIATHDPSKPAPVDVPDNPTLGDWRVALTLWGRMDDVTAKVATLVASSDAGQQKIGKIASERLNYSNNVLRAQLLQLKDAFGFSAADVDESLWRAHQVSIGDLSGTWPLPASK